MSTTKRRIARNVHVCDSCENFIHPGQVYLLHTLFPGNDIVDNKVPWQSRECSACATRYGRGHLVALQPCCDCCLSNSNHGPETEHARLCSNRDHRVEPILVDKRSA